MKYADNTKYLKAAKMQVVCREFRNVSWYGVTGKEQGKVNLILTVVKYTASKQHLCAFTYTQHVLLELSPLRKEVLCHVNRALKTSLQCLSAKAAYELLGISVGKKIKGKKENIIKALFKCSALLPSPQRGITRLRWSAERAAGMTGS